jgi:hypothetical protein
LAAYGYSREVHGDGVKSTLRKMCLRCCALPTMAGRAPAAAWRHRLKDGRLIVEIPPTRWFTPGGAPAWCWRDITQRRLAQRRWNR